MDIQSQLRRLEREHPEFTDDQMRIVRMRIYHNAFVDALSEFGQGGDLSLSNSTYVRFDAEVARVYGHNSAVFAHPDGWAVMYVTIFRYGQQIFPTKPFDNPLCFRNPPLPVHGDRNAVLKVVRRMLLDFAESR